MSSQNCISRLRTASHALFIPMVRLFNTSLSRNYDLICLYHIVVRVRSREGRRNRAPPPRIRWKDGKKVNPAVAAAEEAKGAAAAAKA